MQYLVSRTLVATALLMPLMGFGQSEVSFFILSGKVNAQKLASTYFSPLGKSMYNNLGNGWLQGGELLKRGQLSLGIQASATFFPEEDQSFDINAIGLSQKINVLDGQRTWVPTAIGERINGAELTVMTENPNNGEQIPLVTFSTPDGMGIPLLPMASAQVSIGLAYQTELMLRGLPPLSFRTDDTDYDTYLWGLGLKHELSQWFSEEIFPLDIILSLTYGHQYAHGKPQSIGTWDHANGQNIERTPEQQSQQIYQDQQLKIAVGAFSTELLLAKSISTFRFYAGFNYTSAYMNVVSEGVYPMVDVRPSTQPPYYAYFFYDEENPVQLHIPSGQFSLSMGVAYQIGIINMQVKASLGDYKNITAGMRFTIL